ncbi:MAG: FkbM family methyltransferase [Betaproteobacteria bacterium]
MNVQNAVLDYGNEGWNHAFPEPKRGIRERPLILLGPFSHLGGVYGPSIVQQCPNVIAVVDDQYKDERIHGAERWTSEQFRQRAPTIDGLLGVDLAGSPLGHTVFSSLLSDCKVERADLVEVLAELGLGAVYQSPRDMRQRTIARQPEWLQLRAALADDASRATLDAALLLRLTYDRRVLRSAMTGPEDEYFSVYRNTSTFRLHDDEIFADCGAYIGSTVRKVIAATDGRFRAIHAFEPDRKSFAELEKLRALRMPGIVLHNAAVGDTNGHIRFLETGTMGSHVDEAAGNIGDTPIVRLDDVMDEVTFVKMDLEGFEQKALRGAARLIRECRPRMAITAYHYADDLLDLWKLFGELAPDYELRLRHHSSYYYDTIFYAAPAERGGVA